MQENRADGVLIRFYALFAHDVKRIGKTALFDFGDDRISRSIIRVFIRKDESLFAAVFFKHRRYIRYRARRDKYVFYFCIVMATAFAVKAAALKKLCYSLLFHFSFLRGFCIRLIILQMKDFFNTFV